MIHILGVRHHGPGSARGVLAALEQLRPDCILVEGPPDAQNLLPIMAHPDMRPPVALLVYAPSDLPRSVFYPFAEFSPEWQALSFGRAQGIEARFFDLPQTHQIPLRASVYEESNQSDPQPAQDPYELMARAAGYERYETWWERVIEQRGGGLPVFEAINEAMAELRRARDAMPVQDTRERRLEETREAHMRQMIRAAKRDGFERIAVVCGAWHGPALVDLSSTKTDAQLLKGLPTLKVAATWSPWTFGRLTFASGYGAGVESPGWYQHQWDCRGLSARQMVIRWLATTANLLRTEGLDVSSAHLIEAARLAETLAALRGRDIPDLGEVSEAILSVICGGDATPLRLIHEKQIVGETLGQTPDDTPAIPLERDLQTEQKRLRLAPSAEARYLELDLRQPLDLERSRLFHRLNILEVTWAVRERATNRGTFKEAWRLRWNPELAVNLIEAGIWGGTIVEASAIKLRALADGLRRETFISGGQAATPPALAQLTSLLNTALVAELPGAVGHIMQRLKDRAATSGDVTQLMESLPSLAEALRYGNVRQTDASMIKEVVDGFVTRISIGLSQACLSLNDDAARQMVACLDGAHSSVTLIQDPAQLAEWQQALRGVMERQGVHGALAGRAARLLRDEGGMDQEESVRRFGFALSSGNDPTYCAAWVEGFLSGGGALLLHDDALRSIVDRWLTGIAPEAFLHTLPLLRRAFSQFNAHERRNLGELIRQGVSYGRAGGMGVEEGLDVSRAEQALPLVMLMLGIKAP